jgi:hypothetical protein
VTNEEPPVQTKQNADIDDGISRQAAIDAIAKMMPKSYTPDGSHPADDGIFMAQEIYADCIQTLKELPAVQPEPLSDAYAKAVWTWLLDYQIKAAKLKGRYTPYEVLSWVANDWRKEHEGSD